MTCASRVTARFYRDEMSSAKNGNRHAQQSLFFFKDTMRSCRVESVTRTGIFLKGDDHFIAIRMILNFEDKVFLLSDHKYLAHMSDMVLIIAREMLQAGICSICKQSQETGVTLRALLTREAA